jgi:hypothetical protein
MCGVGWLGGWVFDGWGEVGFVVMDDNDFGNGSLLVTPVTWLSLLPQAATKT